MVGLKRYRMVALVFLLVISVGAIGAYMLLRIDNGSGKVEAPSETQGLTLTSTAYPTDTFTPTSTSTLLPTRITLIIPSATTTVTLGVRIAQAQIIMPGVTLSPTATPLPDDLQILAEPPEPIEPLPNATLLPFPYTNFTDWVAFESDHPAMRYTQGEWTPIGSLQASQGQYHYSEDTDAKVSFTFSGEAVRVRYVGFTNGGVWNVLIDGEVVDTIDSYAPIGSFTGTRVYFVGPGEHTIELHNSASANEASTGNMIAFDAMQVYRPDELTLVLPGGVLPTDTPTPTLIPAQDIELIQAPPSPQPTATEVPIQIVNASIVIGYDENANGTIDVSEGVSGISVRFVEAGTNRVVAHAFTDEQGFAQLQASTNSLVQLVVPYFGESWSVQSRGSEQSFTLLLSPGNQPGLIP
jgi:hypothetical protein